MKFKKIMSILGGALLIGATIGGAQVLTSYTSGSLKNVSSPSIVYGQNAAPTDYTGATDILTALNSTSSITVLNQSNITGEAKKVETSSQPLYFGDLMNSTKATFTKDQLPTVLADGSISDSDGKDYDYNLRINVPNARVIYGETPDNLEPPIIYADFNSPNIRYDMRIVFPTAVDPSKLDGEQITLFGKTYTFSSNTADLTTSSVTMFENSQTLRIPDGNDVTNNGHTYHVAVESTTEAIVYVDGVSKNVKEGFSGKINGVDVYVREIFGPNYVSSGQQRYVDIYLNADSLKLENGQEVKKAGNDISGTKTQFVLSGGKISEIKISVVPYQLDNEIRYLKQEGSFVDPVFNSVKFYLDGIIPPLTDSERDYLELGATREDQIGITFTNRLDKKYELDVLGPSSTMLDANYAPMYNSTCTTWNWHWVDHITQQQVWNDTTNMTDTVNITTPVNETYCATLGTYTYNATELRVSSDASLIVETNKEILEGDYFVTTSGEYSQIWKVDNIRNDYKVDIRDAMGGDAIKLSMGSIGGTASLSLADGSSATLQLVNGTSIVLQDKASNYLYTYKGAKIVLPIDNSGAIQIVEETPYNGGDFHSVTGALLGNSLITNWQYKNGRSGRDMFLSGTNYGANNLDYWNGNVGDNDIYTITKYGTFIKQIGDDDKELDIYYPESAVKSNFYMGEINSITSTTTTTNGTDLVLAQDAEMANYQSRNIIVVGGSCINAVAAGLLGYERPVCGEEFANATGVTAGHYLIQAFDNPWTPGKIAVLVAGYNAEDTTRAVSDILTNPINLTVGSKKIV